jgi:hypothetical protein
VADYEEALEVLVNGQIDGQRSNGECPDCGEPTLNGEAYVCCGYVDCEHSR